MSKQNKKVICIKADSGKEYEQVIFVMKDNGRDSALKDRARINFVVEAERIINSKLDMSSIHKAQQNAVLRRENGISQLIIKRTSGLDVALNVILMTACLMLSGILFYMT
ncbi:MAG: hypothetical protein LBU94_05765 [Clostridiales bacterium]|jgi:hypothetical protein|nr:hypothetical protein [Clostridiales bacterium]